MDELDRKLLDLLQHYGLQYSAVLAPQVGLGKRTVQRRLKDLRSRGIYRIIVVPNLLSFNFRAWAIIGVRVAPGSSGKVADVLADLPSVYFLAQSLGTFDIVIAVALPSLEMLTRFINNELTGIEGITGKEAMLLVHPIKYYRYTWPSPARGNGDFMQSAPVSSRSQYQPSDTDMKILSILKEDALTLPGVIGKKLGIADSTVRKRVKYMRDNQSVNQEILPNREVLGSDVWAMTGINTTRSFDDTMLDVIVSDPGVYLASFCLGRFDLLVAARFKDIHQLNRFVNEKIASVAGVGSVTTFLHDTPLKYHNIRLDR